MSFSNLSSILEKEDRRHSANDSGNIRTRLFGVGFGRKSQEKIKEANWEEEEEVESDEDSFNNE